MTALSIRQALAKSELLEGSSDTPLLDVQLLLGCVLNKSTSYFFTWPEKLLSQEQSHNYQRLLERRIQGEPVAYILGYQDFWSLRLEVSADTLIPRPDTELLVEKGLSLLGDGPYRVADLGTGTGAVALAFASERPSWQISATDYVDAAAALAKRNCQSLQLNNVTVVTGSWFEPLSGKYDLIVSNPPYIEADDEHLLRGGVRFEPLTALVAKDHGLSDLQEIIKSAPRYLKGSAWLLLEHGFEQGDAVRQLFLAHGFVAVQTLRDLADNDRITIGQWQPREKS